MDTGKKTVRLHIPDLSEDLHRELKVAAAMCGKSIKQFVIEAIKEKMAHDACTPNALQHQIHSK